MIKRPAITGIVHLWGQLWEQPVGTKHTREDQNRCVCGSEVLDASTQTFARQLMEVCVNDEWMDSDEGIRVEDDGPGRAIGHHKSPGFRLADAWRSGDGDDSHAVSRLPMQNWRSNRVGRSGRFR